MSQTKLIDYAAMAKQFAGDNDLFKRFATRFINTFEKRLKEIDNSFSTGDIKAIKLAIHTFKNLVCNFHAESIYKLLVDMEKLAVVGALDTARSKMEEVVKGTKEIADEIRSLLDKSEPLN